MPRTVFFALPHYAREHDNSEHVRTAIRADLARVGARLPYTETTDPATADLILYLDNTAFKWKSHAAALRADPVLQRHATKTLVVSQEDSAVGFLDGIYIHAERGKFHPEHQRSWLLPWLYNERIYTITSAQCEVPPDGPLCCFRGSVSHRVRQKLIRHFQHYPDPRVSVTTSQGWFDHSVDRKQAYVEELLRSPFVLCPRGLGAFTHRLVETLALGRVPVLLADDWVAPANLPLAEVAVVVPEDRPQDILAAVEAARPRAREMGRAGRAHWLAHYGPDDRLRALLDQAFDLMAQRGRAASLAELEARWQSRAFHRENGWLPHQRLFRRLDNLLRPPTR